MMVFVLTNSFLTWEEKGCVLHEKGYILHGNLCTAFSDDLKAHFKTDLNYFELHSWSAA